ncbi:MAG: hypothetical protein KDA41_03700, partial [Planctomycetales bacterium]|nr:hypothetical protein [Planctomycetales bacterium]
EMPKYLAKEQYLLVFIASVTLALEAWMIVEAVLVWPKAKGVLEEALPPLAPRTQRVASGGGRT